MVPIIKCKTLKLAGLSSVRARAPRSPALGMVLPAARLVSLSNKAVVFGSRSCAGSMCGALLRDVLPTEPAFDNVEWAFCVVRAR